MRVALIFLPNSQVGGVSVHERPAAIINYI